ncbi:MAG TPA: peptidoglycan binding domain-containing protein, partial [Chloroflexota bacterium]|nr:peptidoglycan binding domain-containing protein [Chloroflexota bacterium]
MEAKPPIQAQLTNHIRHIGFFLIAPLMAVLLLLGFTAVTAADYQSQHSDRIFTGVSALGVDLSGLTQAEAQAALEEAFSYPQTAVITLTDPATGQQWTYNPAELGLSFDAAAVATAAYQLGRTGDPTTRLQAMFDTWYYGRTLSPQFTLDEAQLDQKLAVIAAAINRAPANAALNIADGSAAYTAGQYGRLLDAADARQRLLPALTQFREAELELLVHQ